MKKVLMILMLCIPIGLHAQGLQNSNYLENEMLNTAYVDYSNFFAGENISEPPKVKEEKEVVNHN